MLGCSLPPSPRSAARAPFPLAALTLATLAGCGGASMRSTETGAYRPPASRGTSPTYTVATSSESGGAGGGAAFGISFDEEEVYADYDRPMEGAYEYPAPEPAGVAEISFETAAMGGLAAGSTESRGRGEEAEERRITATGASVARAGGERERTADAGRVLATAGDTGEGIADATTATDAGEGGPLLIYTGDVWIAVYEVRESQETIVSRATELGGFVQRRTDTELVLRVPAAQFDALVESVSGVGDLLHREIAAQDVSEEFHDVEIRIRNLEAMRTRLEALLAAATAVEDALRVERELERVTLQLESLRGRQRFLSDRLAFATLTIHFQAMPRDRIDQPEIFALPFYWLQQLGLPSLLELH